MAGTATIDKIDNNHEDNLFRNSAYCLLEYIRKSRNISSIGPILDSIISKDSDNQLTKRQWFYVFKQLTDDEFIIKEAAAYSISSKGEDFLNGKIEIEGRIVGRQLKIVRDSKIDITNLLEFPPIGQPTTQSENSKNQSVDLHYIRENYQEIARDYNNGLTLSLILPKYSMSLNNLLDALITYSRQGKKLRNLEYLANTKSVSELISNNMDEALNLFHNKKYQSFIQFYKDPISTNDFKILYLKHLNAL